MEEGQRLNNESRDDGKTCCLNPCCNGRGSKTQAQPVATPLADGCLNPCCNGRGSKTQLSTILHGAIVVLILVVMEEGQRR